jgi:uncharacterized lipoprotein YehR (DUF1307 family)
MNLFKFNFWALAMMLVSLSAGLSSCDDDESAKTITCLPTELPGEESALKITYNAQNQIDFVQYEEYDNPQPNEFKSKYTYTNGKVSKIEHFDGTSLEGYQTIEYQSNVIVEKVFDIIAGSSNAEQTEQNTYYLQNGRIITIVNREISFSGYDSALLTYTGENVTRMQGYDKSKKLVYTDDIEYDNNFNPYKAAGINPNEEFYGVFTISANNPTKSTYKESSSTEEVTITYTYDGDGKPLTRKFDFDTEARSFKYNCQ